MPLAEVLIAGRWRESARSGTFRAENPALREPIEPEFPISRWEDCDAALDAARTAWEELRRLPPEIPATFLERYADRIEAAKGPLVDLAHRETALPATPRLAEVELPRTIQQLRLAAAAAREQSWALPTIDTKANIRSAYASLGPVCVLGPNNFPFAFGSISGGDFAAAIAVGCPVIAKANSSHPGTTRLFAIEAHAAAEEAGLPAGTLQLLYRLDHEDGKRLVADPRLGATGYTGSRRAGLELKAAADAAGRPIYLELSSINPVVILPGALRERCERIADEFATSCLMGTGQFCTNPGLVLLLAGEEAEEFISAAASRFQEAPVGTLLSSQVAVSLDSSLRVLRDAGASVVVGGTPGGGQGYCFSNTLLRVTAERFLQQPEKFQTEAFGNASLFVIADDVGQAGEVLRSLEGNLTGCFYTDTRGSDDATYADLAPLLRPRVGRLLNDKMPTGVAVSPAMVHGGPFPATGHGGFTAVGIPASLRRFAALHCYDNVRPHRLPALLRDENPNGRAWRLVDGSWTTANVV